ncbi:unnamed protein product [Schistocephalus solidus]|uniref:Homeobox protein C11 n=1 Tax=Schistocephalus solidus TaxID=70667 RepID=A0A183SB42_SCHSO|nr:unnamed protein product [Schistocephalus solidus]
MQKQDLSSFFYFTELESHPFPYEAQDLVSYQSHLLAEKQENQQQCETRSSSDLSHFSTSTDIPGLEPMFIPRYSAHTNWYQCNMDEATSGRSRYQDIRETSGGGSGVGSSYDSFPTNQQPRTTTSALLHEHGAPYFGQSCLGMQMHGQATRQTVSAATAAAAWATQSFAGFPGNQETASRMTPLRYLHLPSSEQLWGAATYGLPPGFGGADFCGAVTAGCSAKTDLSPSSSSAASAYRFPGDLSGSGGDSGGSQKPSPTDPYSHTGHHQQHSGLADEAQGCKQTLVNN